MKLEDGINHHKEKHIEDFHQKKKLEKQKQIKL
jgi:hypothetical protein